MVQCGLDTSPCDNKFFLIIVCIYFLMKRIDSYYGPFSSLLAIPSSCTKIFFSSSGFI